MTFQFDKFISKVNVMNLQISKIVKASEDVVIQPCYFIALKMSSEEII